MCPECKRQMARAERWRAEAYKQAGHEVDLPWTGLTDEEINQAESGCWFLNEFDKTLFARAIEDKLRELNT